MIDLLNPLHPKGLYHLTISLVLAVVGAVVTLLLGFLLGWYVSHLLHRGGFLQGPLPPATQLKGGIVPASHSLGRFVTHTHNQDGSNSCVGQTLAAIEEITWAERGIRKWFSAGYIYNQLNGGQDNGLTYEAAFGLLIRQGDALHSEFPYEDGDGNIYAQPGGYARRRAYTRRFASWIHVAAWDRHTMEREIAGGRPLAVALPIRQSLYNALSQTYAKYTISSQYGGLLFSHSMECYAYDRIGLTCLNSWGGFGRVRFTWGFLNANNAEVVASAPKSWQRHRKKAAHKRRRR